MAPGSCRCRNVEWCCLSLKSIARAITSSNNKGSTGASICWQYSWRSVIRSLNMEIDHGGGEAVSCRSVKLGSK